MNKKPHSLLQSQSQILLLGVLIVFLASLTFSWSGPLQEDQEKPSSQESRLENSTKTAIIDWICLKMKEIYVFPDVPKKMIKERSPPDLSCFSIAPAIVSPRENDQMISAPK